MKRVYLHHRSLWHLQISCPSSYTPNIVAAFRGMHVSPAKHSYAWLPRKCDYRTDGRTDRQTDAGQSDPYVPLCFAGDTINYCVIPNQHVMPAKAKRDRQTCLCGTLLRWHHRDTYVSYSSNVCQLSILKLQKISVWQIISFCGLSFFPFGIFSLLKFYFKQFY